MKIEWEAEDIRLGMLVIGANNTELSIVTYADIKGAMNRRIGLTSLRDGQFLDAGGSISDLAMYLTKYKYTPFYRQEQAEAIIKQGIK